MAGNRGQATYSAGNDALETVITNWGRQHDGVRAVTVHWGPWAPSLDHPGMVSPEPPRQLTARGVGMIDPELGATCLLQELAWADPADTAVTYLAPGWTGAPTGEGGPA